MLISRTSRYGTICVFATLFITHLFSFAQDEKNLYVLGTIYEEVDELKAKAHPLESVSVSLFAGDSLIKKVQTGKKGKFEIYLPMNKECLLKFSKAGYISKKVSVSTTHIPLFDMRFDFQFGPMPVTLFKKVEGMNQSLFDQPVAKIRYDLDKGYFDYDRAYTEAIQTKFSEARQDIKQVFDMKEEYALLNKLANDKLQKEIIEIRKKADIEAMHIIEQATKQAERILQEAKETARLLTNSEKNISLESYSIIPETKAIVNKSTEELAESRFKLIESKEKIGRARAQLELDKLKSKTQQDSLIIMQREAAIVTAENKITDAENKILLAENEISMLSKESEIQRLQITRNNYFIYGLLGIILFIVLITFLMLKQYKLKAEHQTTELKQKLLRSQMNPHFIFNSLNSIQNFVHKDNLKESAKYVASFSQLIRLILDNSREEYITIEKELKTLNLYLELQKLRFKNRFNYTLDVDPNIELTEQNIPPMLAQPFIENSIEHGIMHKPDGGEINIRFSLEGRQILFEVEDNGVGRNISANLANSDHEPLATMITRERISILNKKSRKKIRLNIIDIKNNNGDECGTKVTFSIPNKLF